MTTMTTETVEYLSVKYGVAPAIIRRLAGWSRKYQVAKTAKERRRVMNAYNVIVATECGGIDPLV